MVGPPPVPPCDTLLAHPPFGTRYGSQSAQISLRQGRAAERLVVSVEAEHPGRSRSRPPGSLACFSVRYSYGSGKQLWRPLHLQFDGDQPRPFGAGTVSITVYPVPSGERGSVMAQLESSLPASLRLDQPRGNGAAHLADAKARVR